MAFVTKGIDCQSTHANNYGIREYSEKSEHRSEFGFKTSINDVAYEKAAAVPRMQFARQLFNRANQVMPTAIQTNSTYRNDFSAKSLKFEHPMRYDVFCDSISQRAIDRCVYAHQPGYQKYLDIYAPLNYPLHPIEELNRGLSKRDHITYWDWIQEPKTRGITVHVEVPPQKCNDAIDKSVIRPIEKNKFVPNRGLFTEHQEHYRLK